MDVVKSLLQDPIKGQRRAQGILCFLFRQTLLWKEINWLQWLRRLDLYFEKPHNKNKPLDKGNLNKTLSANDLTWNSFVVGIDFLNPISATFKLMFEFYDGRQSEYVIAIDPAENQDNPGTDTFDYEDCQVLNLVEPKKNRNKPLNKLALLFRHILKAEGLDDEVKWTALLKAYVDNPLHGIGKGAREKTQVLNQIQAALAEPNMTWNTFRRGVLVINPKVEKYQLKLVWTDNPKIIKLAPHKAYTLSEAVYRDKFDGA